MIEFTAQDLDRSHIPIGEVSVRHECPSSNKFYDIERGRKRSVVKTPFTNDWCMIVNGYYVTIFYCPYCSKNLMEEEK